MVVHDDDPTRRKIAAKAMVEPPILSVMQGAHYIQNFLLYQTLQLMGQIQLCGEMVERLVLKETSAQVPITTAQSHVLREELAAIEVDLGTEPAAELSCADLTAAEVRFHACCVLFACCRTDEWMDGRTGWPGLGS